MSQLNLNPSEHIEKTTYFAEIILPLPLHGTFTYRIPFNLVDLLMVGSRVVVQFGRKKILTGIIYKIHTNPPEKYEAKSILDSLDPEPIINEAQLKFFGWISSYYMSSLGDVMNAAIPSGLKLSSESYIQLNPTFDINEYEGDEISDREEMIINHLINNQQLSYVQIEELLGIKSISATIKSLLQKDIILLFEELKEKFKPKYEKRIRLAPQYTYGEEALEELFQVLEKKPKQIDVLLKFLQIVPVMELQQLNPKGVQKAELTKSGISDSSLKTLTKNGVFEEFQVVIPRVDFSNDEEQYQFTLSSDQERAYNEIIDQFEKHDTVLFQGITGSGKTEIYIKLIAQALQEGGQVLYLVPEIALTTQIIRRLRKHFGDSLGVFHSKYSDSERVEVYNGIISQRYSFVIGVRSAIFLPFDNLSLIIVDEEHETTFKQYDRNPRFHARDSSIVLAQIHHAKVLLGTATPSLESYYNALHDRYGLVELNTRYGNVEVPKIHPTDMRAQRKKKLAKGDFSSVLFEELKETLEKNEQAIIFQNRRGYAPFLTCDDCGHIPKCPNCAVSLTYHMYQNNLKCHYCGYKEPSPTHCDSCNSNRIRTVGIGTERIEEELKTMLPEARIQRMDLDTTRKKYSYQQMIEDFENGQIDILVGTQMITKGLDFDKVTKVGILDADGIIHFPNFRSHERAFQLITQVSGRAGRRDKPGKVILQTNDTEQYVIQRVANYDFKGFYQSEILEREKYHYPPFFRLIQITFKDRDRQVSWDAAQTYMNLVKSELGKQRIKGPAEPIIGKIRNQFLTELIVSLERDKINLAAVKRLLLEKLMALEGMKQFKSVRVVFDVDPY